MRQKGAFAEKSVGCVLSSGCLITVIASILTWMFTMGGVLHGTLTREPGSDRITDAGDLNLVPVSIFFLAVGVFMMIGAVGYGFWRNSQDRVGDRRVEQNLKVLARYVYESGRLLTSDWEIEGADNPRYYIRAMYANGVSEELETTPEVYFQCGEGMFGEAEIQSRWLGRFTPYIGVPPTS
jgi:hypothetical protein